MLQVVVGAHGTGDAGQEYTVTKEEIENYLSYHSHLGKEVEESQIARIIAEVPHFCCILGCHQCQSSVAGSVQLACGWPVVSISCCVQRKAAHENMTQEFCGTTSVVPLMRSSLSVFAHELTDRSVSAEVEHTADMQARFQQSQSLHTDVSTRPQALRPSFRQGSMRGSRSSIGGVSDIDRTASGAPPWYQRASIDRTTVMKQLEDLQSRRERCGLDPNISEEDIQSVVRSVQVLLRSSELFFIHSSNDEHLLCLNLCFYNTAPYNMSSTQPAGEYAE